jgi:branched-chain amino acid transport system ATP-binding protein
LGKTNILNIEDLSVSYGIVKALRNININVFEGEIVCLIGANGSGKSTLLETILGVHKPDRGHIKYFEKEITNFQTETIVASGICLVPEGRGILPAMTVYENLLLGAYHKEETLKINLELVYQNFPVLFERKKQVAKTLSGGEQQMLSIGRALMSEPKLMMLDEPSLGLSPLIVEQVFKIIKNLKNIGYTILLSEQNARKSLQYSDRGYVFETGQIALSGNSNKLTNTEKVRHAYLGG